MKRGLKWIVIVLAVVSISVYASYIYLEKPSGIWVNGKDNFISLGEDGNYVLFLDHAWQHGGYSWGLNEITLSPKESAYSMAYKFRIDGAELMLYFNDSFVVFEKLLLEKDLN